MDIRRNTFVAETTARFEFLLHEHGFTEPQAAQHGEFPMLLTVSYRRADLEVDISLVQAYAGEEHIDTCVTATSPNSRGSRTQVGSHTARTGFQMRQTLDRQAQTLSELLAHQQPRRPEQEL